MRKNIQYGTQTNEYILTESQKRILINMLSNGWETIEDELPNILSVAARNYSIMSREPKTINNTEIREELSKIRNNLSKSAGYLSGLPQADEKNLDQAFWLANNKDEIMLHKLKSLDHKTKNNYLSSFSYLLDGMINAIDHSIKEMPTSGKKGDLDLLPCIVEIISAIKELPVNTENLIFSSSERSVFYNIIVFFLRNMLDHPIKNPNVLIDKATRRVNER